MAEGMSVHVMRCQTRRISAAFALASTCLLLLQLLYPHRNLHPYRRPLQPTSNGKSEDAHRFVWVVPFYRSRPEIHRKHWWSGLLKIRVRW